MSDYKGKIAQLLESLHDWQSEEGTTDASMLTVAIEAQVLATQQLAEQQRIANLIALARVEAEGGGTDRRTWDSVFETVSEGFSAVFSVRPEIREGLALS